MRKRGRLLPTLKSRAFQPSGGAGLEKGVTSLEAESRKAQPSSNEV